MHLTRLAAAVAIVACSSPAMAAVTIVDDAITAGPSFNRTVAGFPPPVLSTVGTDVFYDAIPFTVTGDGAYSLALDAAGDGFDAFLLIYENGFDPLSPLSNIVVADDDSGTGLNSLVNFLGLTAGVSYVAVATTFNNGETGGYRLTLTGTDDNAAIISGTSAVPEPGSWAMMMLGFGLIGGALRSRSRNVKVSFG